MKISIHSSIMYLDLDLDLDLGLDLDLEFELTSGFLSQASYT